MEEKINGILIKSVSYGENDKILTIFSLEQGIISAKIKGVKKAGAKLKFASEPFCFSEYIMLNRNNMRSVINASMFDSFYSLREDINKYYAGMSILEFIRLFCPENAIYGELFIATANALKQLAYSQDSVKKTLINFFLLGLEYIGYGLDLSGCLSCNSPIAKRVFFDFEKGGAYCEECRESSSVEISAKTYLTLKSILYENDEVILEENYLTRSLKLIARYIIGKTGETNKSLEEFLRL